MNPENLAQAVQELQAQLQTANTQLATQQNNLNEAASSYTQLKAELDELRAKRPSREQPKKNEPDKFTGKGSITSWVNQMDNYLSEVSEEEALPLAVSYLSGSAHEWWIVHHQTETGQLITTWAEMKESITSRFDTLNKEKVARDKLAKWRQIKDVSSFNDDFQKILLDIPSISKEEKIDRYTRGLKSYIWKELCTNDYKELQDAMRDAERVEAAHRRLGTSNKSLSKPKNDGPAPMEIGNIQLKKLTQEERDRCMKEGRCLRCREKGHIAKNCPKAQRN